MLNLQVGRTNRKQAFLPNVDLENLRERGTLEDLDGNVILSVV
jgi:hypothetical protein